MELKEKTKLSSRTLAKHLNQMRNLRVIERKEDIESGKYPVPVLYKATSTLTTYIRASIAREKIVNGLESVLDETKDPLIILEAIHHSSQAHFITILMAIQQDNTITNEEIIFRAECFLWENYKQWTAKLIGASRKIINDLNFTQLYINQAKRQKEISELLLKSYEKMEQKTNHNVSRNPDNT